MPKWFCEPFKIETDSCILKSVSSQTHQIACCAADLEADIQSFFQLEL